jgi:predicted Zn-dependent protease with MMP-like domain
MERPDFEAIVRDAVESLPHEFHHVLENVAIVIEEEPDPVDAAGDELFGLYQGVPLNERGSGYTGLPDQVFIYRGPIERSCHSAQDIAAEVRDTLIHELGHHMGMSDDEMPY